jgi:hypothetical protein
MRPGSAGWWSGKLRQARRHLGARVQPAERASLATWLSPDQLRLFDGMHAADRRHGLDVVAWLRADGIADREALLAGLLHDAGKGDAGFVSRVLFSLSQAYGRGISRAGSMVPPLATSLACLEAHADLSATLAAAAGCSPRTVELIRHQDDPEPADLVARRLHLADDAS